MSESVRESFDISNKVVIITGGAGLLGEKHAEAVAEFGGIPVLLDLDEQSVRKIAQKISTKFETKCIGIKCDITNYKHLEDVRDQLLHDYENIDILINNAAIDPKVEIDNENNLSRLENYDIDQWNKELNVGLTGAMLCSKIFGPLMVKNGNGVILNISSDLGIIAPDQRLYRKDGVHKDATCKTL